MARKSDKPKVTVKQLLRDLDLGNSVAEFDDQLENYFLQTQPFEQLIKNKVDIIAGDKGTGKTAIFTYLYKKYKDLPKLKNVVVIPAFNPSGHPVFMQLVEKGLLEEKEYARLWKTFFFALVGNWALAERQAEKNPHGKQLAFLLKGLDLRSDSLDAVPIFRRLLSQFASLLRWKSAEVAVETTPEGNFTFTPKVEFGGSEGAKDQPLIAIDSALEVLNKTLLEIGVTAWVAIDRLDEAFHGEAAIEIPALRALFRSYLDMLGYKQIQLKLFVRRDLFSRITAENFVNLTHINAKKIEVTWDEEDLINLLCRRVKQNQEFLAATKLKKTSSDIEIMNVIFPDQVDQGERKPVTEKWIMSRIQDGNGIRPPRNLIDLASLARDAQLRKEERESREYSRKINLLEPDALRQGLSQLSERRVEDTLLAEARQLSPVIAKFRKSRSEHNRESLAELLGASGADLDEQIKALQRFGFLEETGQSFKVPMLYRGGLEIRQGKAFDPDSDEDDD